MNSEPTTSPNAAFVLEHGRDPRPAWLYGPDGRLIWRNLASAYFLAKAKKSGIKLAAPAAPIKGQIARVLRLGAEGRTSLSRIRFIAGGKPGSATCACTPLAWENGQQVLLIVGVDPIDAELIESEAADLSMDAALWQGGALGSGPEHEVPEADGGTPEMVADDDHEASADKIPEESVAETQAPLSGLEILAADRANGDVEAWTADVDGQRRAGNHRLSDLANRLIADEQLFTPLTDEDDPPLADEPPAPAEAEADEERVEAAGGFAPPEPEAPPAGLFRVIGRYLRRATDEDTAAAIAKPAIEDGFEPGEETDAEADVADLARLDAVEQAGDALSASEPEPQREPEAESTTDAIPVDVAMDIAIASINAEPEVSEAEAIETEPDPVAAAEVPADAETVERVSRYNFDELSRILNDRIGERTQATSAGEAEKLANAPAGSILANRARQPASSSLINLSGETLVLNRLPLGILVFRNQDVLFANRAITEMTGYDSVESLRGAGLAAIFPGGEGSDAGPVNHLVQRDGTLVPVTARLQSISWNGRPALMLSASATEVRTGHEEAVRAFAQAFAEARGDGYFEASRSGTISVINAKAIGELGHPQAAMTGKPLAELVSHPDLTELQAFLERPARFAETARPCIRVKAAAPDAELLIFAQGQAGIVSGYFGFVHRIAPPQAPRLTAPAEPDAALLARVSRGVRRPLNTIIGFSDLIRSAAFGTIENERYLDYAGDIKTAGQEIATLVDELDDYARLKDGRYLPQRATLDLLGLLESCVLRIRGQANARRVIVRSALSEKLPRVTADRASLAQAVLNLLASAIDQTPVGGAVVISAQQTDDGGIAIHVRDNSDNETDLSERFVVFRDGTGRDGQALTPVRSSVGLALTRSLLAVNAFSLSVDPAGSQGMLFSMLIPRDLVAKADTPDGV